MIMTAGTDFFVDIFVSIYYMHTWHINSGPDHILNVRNCLIYRAKQRYSIPSGVIVIASKPMCG